MTYRLLALAAFAGVLFVPGAQASTARHEQQPTLAQLVGQHLLVRMPGTRPSAAFLARIRRGEIGGVVLFGNNIPASGPAALVDTLQSAARAGKQLPLVIAVDQEGGVVKRLPGPPTKAPSAMASTTVAHAQGLATGRYLHRLGITVDLAPVLDTPVSPRAFIASRAFSENPDVVAARGAAFIRGVDEGGTAATAKHFPGLGRLLANTDFALGRVTASRTALERDLVPFAAAVRAGAPAVLVGTAVYPAYGSTLPAACSRSIVSGVLRGELGFRGVAFSDDLDTAGVRKLLSPGEATVRAVQAGIDMVYVAGVGGSGGEAIGEQAYAALLQAARSGRVSTAELQASYARVETLKQRFVVR